MDVRRAAAQLEVDPKKFRAFLRSHSRYKSPGAGGKYDLSSFTIEYLSQQYALWAGLTTSTIAPEDLPELPDDSAPGLPLGTGIDAVRRLNRERDARLLTRLRELGMSLAARRDDDTWLRVTTARIQPNSPTRSLS